VQSTQEKDHLFAKRNDVTPEDILARYKQANQDLLSAQASLTADMKAAEALGLSENQIIQQLSVKSKMGRDELGAILSGKFRPITITKQLIEDIMMESIEGQARVTTAENLPIDKLIDLSIEFSQINLNPKVRSPQPNVVSEDNPFPPFVPSQPQAVVQQPQAQPTESFIAPVTEAVSGAVDTVSDFGSGLLNRARTLAPGLLGDPKNQAIVDRANQ